MAGDFDPNNLSAGDVFRAIAPTVALVVALVLVGKFAPKFIWLFIVLLGGGIYVYVAKLPKKDLAAIAEKEQELEGKIGKIPVVGWIAKPAWRLLNWIGVILGAIMIIVFVLASVTNLF